MDENRDYQKLLGKSVSVHSTRGVVQNIDPDIGITVVAADDPKCKLWCLMRPEIAKARYGVCFKECSEGYYRRLFDHFVKGIESGYLDEIWYWKAEALLAEEYGEYAPSIQLFVERDQLTDDRCAFSG